ncbi:hypothetical protein [Amphritea sp. HPY]|uniref:hypothetical protein n=1 Tax=Amphritea sp. HPY TaxID=3421652 RepID=UPI003D7F1088
MLSASKQAGTQRLDCLLEYSHNVSEAFDNRVLFNSLHLLLAENNRFLIEEIQSRAVIYDRYYIGDGDEENAFIQLTITSTSTLDKRLKVELGDKVMALLEAEFSYSIGQLNCTVTVRINEISALDYCHSTNKVVR